MTDTLNVIFPSIGRTRRYLFEGQVRGELGMSLWAIPWMAHLTVPFFLAEINGHSRYRHD